MRKLWVLLKLNFRAMLRAFSFRSGAGSSKKKAAGGLGALLLMAFLALYLSGVYSFLLASMLAEVGIVEMVLPLMALMACVMSLMFTLFAASGLVFGGKDSDIVLALPVPAFTVMLSKILALYLENLVFCGLWMLPTGAAYLVYAGLGAGQAAGFCVRLLAAALFLPLLPSVLALLGGWVIAYFSGRMKHKSLVGTVLSIVLTGAVLVGSLQINALAAALLQNIEGVRRTLHTWLLPLGLLLDGLVGSWGALLGFLLISLAPFLVLVWGMSTQYKRILSSLASHVTRSDYRLREVKAGGRFAALFKKECGRYFGTTIYLLNTGIGAVMLLGFSVYVLFVRGQAALLVAQMGGAQAVAPMLAAVVCLMQATVNTACVSISLEGRTLWILKEAPVPPRELFGAKALVNVLVSDVPAALSVLLLWFGLGLSAPDALALLALCVCMGLFIPVAGLAVNLWLPRLDCENDTIVVKQSASSMIGIFGGMLVVGLGALLWAVGGKLLGFVWFSLAAAAVLLAGRWAGTGCAVPARVSCRSCKEAGTVAENMKKRETRIQKAGGVIGGVIGIASIVFAMAVVVFSGVSVKLTGTALELSGGIGDRASIPYTEITGVEWRDVFDKGSRTWGTGTGKISSGTFTNDEFGAYRLYLHNRVRCAVVVRHGADETTVFNGETEEKTKEVYEELASRAKT